MTTEKGKSSRNNEATASISIIKETSVVDKNKDLHNDDTILSLPTSTLLLKCTIKVPPQKTILNVFPSCSMFLFGGSFCGSDRHKITKTRTTMITLWKFVDHVFGHSTIILLLLFSFNNIIIVSAKSSVSSIVTAPVIPTSTSTAIQSHTQCHGRTRKDWQRHFVPLQIATFQQNRRQTCSDDMHGTWRSAVDLYSQSNVDNQKLTLLLRGGAIIRSKTTKIPSASTKQEEDLQLEQIQQRQRQRKMRLFVIAGACTVYGLWYTRDSWTKYLDKEHLQHAAVETLHRLNDMPKVSSYTSYILGMAIWETVGMSTIPVETAAGMVFGWPDGFWLSAIGKLLGACFAFGLGRYGALSKSIEQQFSKNTFLQLVQNSTKNDPLLVAFLMKFSCLPETVKNFGSSILHPIQWWMFILATIVHGWTFTSLWTYLGIDTAARIEDVDGLIPPNATLQTLLTLALINGFVISPISMVYWVRTMKQAQAKKIEAAGVQVKPLQKD